jgi:AraC family transcriptional regulator
VIRDGRIVSLLPVAPTLSSRRTRWEGLTLNVFRDIPACEVPEHVHPTHMVSLVTSGSTTLEWTTGGRTRRALNRPGHLYLLPAGTRDRIQWDRPTSRVILTLEPATIAKAFDETAHCSDIEILERWTFEDRHITALMQALRADLEDGSPAGRLYGETLGLAIAVYLARRYGIPIHTPKHYRRGLPGHRLRLVVDFIHGHLNQDLRLAELAALAGMSPHYFAQLFRQSTGQTPHRYVLLQRVERAKRLLRNGRLSALEIGLTLGFADASHFSKVFRRMVGVTPSAFRAEA